jgi:hypothetical protein
MWRMQHPEKYRPPTLNTEEERYRPFDWQAPVLERRPRAFRAHQGFS